MGTRNSQPSHLSLDPKLHAWQRRKFILTLNLEFNSYVWEATHKESSVIERYISINSPTNALSLLHQNLFIVLK